jgi:hypothetical protein
MTGLSRRGFIRGLLGAAGSAVVFGAAWAGRSRGPTPSTTTAHAAATTHPTTTAATPTSTVLAAPTTTQPPPTTTQPPVRTIPVICPPAWGSLPAVGEFRTHRIERLTVHHTGDLLESNDLAPERIRGHQRGHLDRGWPDLAYHVIIDAAGHVYQGRPLHAVGDTGTEYDPTGHFLVCCEGNFDEQPIPEAQRSRLVDVLAWAATTFAVAPATIAGHRDVAATSCPGDDLYASIADGSLVADVISRLGREKLRFETVCGPEAEALVAAIEAATV